MLSELLFEKLELVDWDLYCQLVAEAYEKAPENDPEAIASFTAMRDFVNKMFKQIESKVNVYFVDGDPYKTADEMREDVKQNRRLKTMKDFSDHPFFSKEENWKFRSLHDWFTHIILGQNFNRDDEIKTYNAHTKMFPPAAWPALFTEIVGQVCYQTTYGHFPNQKVAILKGFDYKNVGRVEGYLINNKRLEKQPV